MFHCSMKRDEFLGSKYNQRENVTGDQDDEETAQAFE